MCECACICECECACLCECACMWVYLYVSMPVCGCTFYVGVLCSQLSAMWCTSCGSRVVFCLNSVLFCNGPLIGTCVVLLSVSFSLHLAILVLLFLPTHPFIHSCCLSFPPPSKPLVAFSILRDCTYQQRLLLSQLVKILDGDHLARLSVTAVSFLSSICFHRQTPPSRTDPTRSHLAQAKHRPRSSTVQEGFR